MLYLILPPIIIIAALVALIYFFSRRFPRVEKEITAHLGNPEAMSAYDMHILDKIKRMSLYVLEHLAQWFKIVALKTYTALHAWTQSVREKKVKTGVMSVTDVSEEIPEGPKRVIQESVVTAAMPIQRVRPMISQRMTKPEAKEKPAAVVPPAPVKAQLEDILVERIAANPRDLEAYERLGEYYMEQGNVQDAKECYRQVLRLSPVHRLAKIKIRRLEKMLEQK